MQRKVPGAVLTSEHREKTAEMDETSCAWIAVDDTKKALQDVGRHLRKRLTLPIVGVTGKCGKDHNERDDRGGPLRTFSCIQDTGQQ